MKKLQSQGVHHITIVGGDRQTSIDAGLAVERSRTEEPY
jgi:hypothetical protein